MCIVSAEAKLSKTRILSMELDNGRHYLAYSNSATNLSGGKNSMILAIPGTVKDFYDTTHYNDFLKDIENQAHIEEFQSRGMRSKSAKGFTKVKLGMYDIIVGNDLLDKGLVSMNEIHVSQRRFCGEFMEHEYVEEFAKNLNFQAHFGPGYAILNLSRTSLWIIIIPVPISRT